LLGVEHTMSGQLGQANWVRPTGSGQLAVVQRELSSNQPGLMKEMVLFPGGASACCQALAPPGDANGPALLVRGRPATPSRGSRSMR